MTDDNIEFDFQKAPKGIQETNPFRRTAFVAPILGAWLPLPLSSVATWEA